MKLALLLLGCTLGSGATAVGAEPPSMGWATFQFFLGDHNDRLMRNMADAYVLNGMREAGFDIMHIDGGWWGNDSSQRWYYWTTTGTYPDGSPYQDGDPHVDPANYPGGLKGLATYMHSQSMKLSFYLSPSLSTGESANFPNNGSTQQQPSMTANALIDRHARAMADAGVDKISYDGYDWTLAQGTAPYYRMASSLASESARVGRRIIYAINSGWSWRASDIADEWRTGRDIAPQWSVIMECLGTVVSNAPAGNGRYNDPSALMIGYPSLTDEEARSQMSLWCLVQAPLILGWDFRAMDAWQRYVLINTEAIAVFKETATLPGQRLSSVGNLDVWTRARADGSVAVVLFNQGGSAADISVSWSSLGLPAGQARVRDLWAHADVGIVSDSYTAHAVPAHGCAMVVVKSGTAVIPPLAAGSVSNPGAKPTNVPLSTAGWTMPSGGGFANAASAFDGNPGTSLSDYAYPGTSFEIALPATQTMTRLLLDHAGVGPNPWPLTFYGQRTTYQLSASADNGGTWTQVASGSLGPAYTPIDFPRTSLNRLRFTFVTLERNSVYSSDPRPGIVDIYAFDLAGQPAVPGDVNGDHTVNSVDRDLIKSQFGRRSSDAGYVTGCDLTGDGRVDAADLNLVLRLQTP